uniref:Protein kinase domain-containing protein n=1 Tax=Kalanchoe fedtschenkoi TaxID=63787 RepID=A0A7N0REC2_KALFE
MGKNLSLLLLLLLTLCCTVLSLNYQTQPLLDFKKQLKDPTNVLSSWLESSSPCDFWGVNCVSGKVTEISLPNQSLSGQLSPAVCALEGLQSLILPSNSISGMLPAELSSCSNLRVLNVSDNSLVGQLPDLSALHGLQILDLGSNDFSGKFPAWVGKLNGLLQLSLANISFDEGKIPDSLGNLKNLTYLFLANCHFVGEIPDSLFGLKALETFDFSSNNLNGDFPRALSTLKNLKKIELYANNFTGVLPVELAELAHLEEIDISTNSIHGTIPKEFGNLKNLRVFQCYSNNLSGELPTGFGDLRNLTSFSVYTNNLYGEVPANLGRYSPLIDIDISENQFSGPFPSFLCGGGTLRRLLAVQNNFSGEFPDTYAQCKTLLRVRFSQNNFSGKLPDSFWALPNMYMLDVSDNGFTGRLSTEIASAINLNQLLMFNNKLSGELPPEIASLTKLEKLLLNSNNFSGRIPSQLGELKLLSSLHLENNMLSGSIPSELGQCAGMVDLNLAMNGLTGQIPKTISHLTALNSLNLSGNKLFGNIPGNLAVLKLSAIDLRNNELSGLVPSELLIVGGDEAMRGNTGLCISDKTRTLTNSELQVCDTRSSHHGDGHRKVLFGIILSALGILIIALVILSYRNYRRTVVDPERDMGVGEEVDRKWKLESFHPIHINGDEICDLGDNNLIGSGGTGKVYRVDLKNSGLSVAVKQLRKGNEVLLMTAEMNVLARIRHKNILKLYACLTRGGSHYLVFEYMSNGNVSQALQRVLKGQQPELDWCRRYNIAVGAAKGIAYLHHDCSPPIIHRDIKSSNILLDDDYEPKIADFGVAKVAGRSPDGKNTGHLAGTHGYIAPELGYSLNVTEKSDVYSFGVVLLELITGKEAIADEYGEGRDIVYWVEAHLCDRLSVLEVLDNKIPGEYQEDMLKVLKIAVSCTAKIPSARPSMRDVVRMLSEADPFPMKHPKTGSKRNSIEEIPILSGDLSVEAD